MGVSIILIVLQLFLQQRRNVFWTWKSSVLIELDVNISPIYYIIIKKVASKKKKCLKVLIIYSTVFH